MLLEIVEVDEFQRDHGGRIEVYLGCAVVVEGFLPTEDAEAPLVAGFEAGEGEFGARGAEVVSLVLTEGEKLLGQHGADTVKATVARSGAAATIAEEAGHGIGGAGGEGFAQDVEVRHGGSLEVGGGSGKSEGNMELGRLALSLLG